MSTIQERLAKMREDGIKQTKKSSAVTRVQSGQTTTIQDRLAKMREDGLKQTGKPASTAPAKEYDLSGEAWTRATPSQTKIPSKETDKKEQQGFFSRAADTVKSGFLNLASKSSNFWGTRSDVGGATAMGGVYKDQADMLQRQIESAQNLLKDSSISYQDRKELEQEISEWQRQLGIYENAVRSNEETGKALYRVSDEASLAAQNSLNRAKDGLGTVGKAAVDVGAVLSELAMTTAAGAVLPSASRPFSVGGGTSSEYRRNADAQNATYDPKKASMLQTGAASGTAVGSALSRGVGQASLNLMRARGIQNYILPNIIKGGVESTGYMLGETGMAELSKALTYDYYEPDWNAIGTQALTSFAFGAIASTIRAVATTRQNKAYINSLNEAVKERYQTVQDIMRHGSPEQKATGAASVMDGVAELRNAINNLQVVGAQKEVDAINRFLNSIDAEMAQYLPNVTDAASKVAGTLAAPSSPLPPSGANAPVSPDVPAPVQPISPAAPPVMPATPPAAPTQTPPATSPSVPSTSVSEQLIAAGSTVEDAEKLAPAIESVLNGEEISGNQAGIITRNDATPSVLETVNPDISARQMQARNVQQVAEFAKTTGKAMSKVMTSMYNQDQAPEEYTAGMMKAYSLGKTGESQEALSGISGINDLQARSAYLAGQADAESAAAPVSSVAETKEADYTGENQSGYDSLKNNLVKSSKVIQDGMRYTVTGTASGYYARIDQENGTGGYVENARANAYKSGPFATREEAVSDLLAVAKSSFYQDESDWLDTIDGKAIRQELSRRAAEGDSPVDGMLREAERVNERQFNVEEENNGLEERGRENSEGNSGSQSENGDRSVVSNEIRGDQGEIEQESSELRERYRKVKSQAEEYGLKAHVVKASDWPPEFSGIPAYSSKGEIYINENIPDDVAEILIPHESTHVMRQLKFEPYLEFMERTPDMIDLSTAAGQALLSGAAEHRHIDLLEIDEKQVETLYDEINAMVSGIAISGKEGAILSDLKEAFHSYDTYREELLSIHQKFKNRYADEKKKEVTPQQQIADGIKKYLVNGKDFTAARLFEIADKAYGGTMASGAYTVKDAYDGMELAVNQYLMSSPAVKSGNGDAASAVKTLQSMTELLSHIPTQTKRTAEMESYQQFSTPPNIAYLAAWCANVNGQDVALEPSAGIGGLALWPKAWGATVYANELSERRFAFLNQLGLDGTFNLNAEQIDNLLPDNIEPSVVIMNPPFSATAGRTATNNTANAKRHIEQALDRLSDGGRLVAILGNGMADDAPAFRSWWDDLRKEYSVRANIRIDGQNYRKYGTTFDVQLVVIDKTGPNLGPTLTRTFKDLSEIPNFMEGIRNDRTRVHSEDSPVPEPVSNRDLGRKSDSGTHSVRAEGPGRGVRSDGNHDGRRSSERTVQRPGDRGTGRGLQQQNGVGERVESDRTGRGENGGRISGIGSDKLQLDRSDLVIAEAQKTTSKEIAENPDSVYATYTPRKVHIKGAKKHPAKLVESAAMAAVEPPDVTYTPSLPKDLVTSGKLSDAQLENIVYAGQAHGQMLQNGSRKGYFIGDGTGVGKGRQLSGIIMDNFLQGRDRAIWVSDKPQLINDAVRDWKDLGGSQDDVLDFSKYKLGQDISAKRGIMFMSYDTLKYGKNDKTRLGDLERWLGKDFDGVICFDEAHNMANSAGKQGKRGKTKPSQKALAGIKLQKMFPKARVVYASATGATDIGDYAYLERLGLWGPGTAFNDSADFTAKISTGGLAAMELVARDMKSMGVYMARSISYDDVTYDTLQHDLTPMQTDIYDTMSRAWQSIFQNIEKALGDTGASLNGSARSAAWSAFYSTQQRFYNQIITSMSMPTVIEDMRRELKNGRSCVLQIVNTNEAAADRAIAQVEDNGLSLDDMDLTPTESLVQYLINSFPVQEYEEYTDEKGNKLSRPVMDKDGKPVLSKKAIRQRDELVEQIKQMRVPDGPLEMLFDAFGVDQVAEVTGRTRRVVEKADENGQMHRVIESRSSKAGIADAQMFQDGKKRILVFSDAGGTGRSYHADLRAKNQQQRVHYLLQPGWNASKATQGFGRTHRSNEASAPIFRLVTTNVMGQKRFTSTIARRLDQLGALTKGQRQAGSGIFGEKDNLEGPIAQDALQQYYKQLPVEIVKKLGLYPKLYDTRTGAFKTEDNTASRDIGIFLNRILSLEVKEQNEVFQGFYDTFDRMMDVAIANGTVDMGLENYRADKIEVKDEKVIRKDPSGADTKYVQMTAYNKPELITLSAAKKLHDKFQGLVRLEDGGVRAVYEISSKTNPRTGEVQRRFKLESPVRGKSSVYVEDTMKAKTTAIDKADWTKAWKEETAKAPEYTESTLHLLTGTLLPIWDRLPENNTRVMRVVSSDGKQYLGRVIRADQIDSVLKGLGANRTMQTYTPQQINEAVLTQGKEVILRDNRWKIVRRRVSGEWRMEVTGQNTWYLPRQYPEIITERINYEYRYFIPTGKNGEKLLSDLMKNNPVVDVREQTQTGDVDQMRGGRAADHSDEWTAKRVGDSTKKPKRISEIIEQIRRDYGLNVTTGHIRGSDIRGQYDRRSHGIRSRIANDLPTIAHELGHHFDNTYGLQDGMTASMKQELLDKLDPNLANKYSKKKLLGEGIAEYVRKFLQNREVAAIDYPEFHKYFMQQFTGQDLAILEQLADEVNAYYSQDIYNRAKSVLRYREDEAPDARTCGEKIKAKANVLYQAWVDSNRGIREFDKATGANTYKLATNAAYSDAIAGQIITGDLTDANGQYVGPGLKSALHGLDMNDEKEYSDFNLYLVSKHGPERLAEGKRVYADDILNDETTMNTLKDMLEQQYPEFKEISERLYQFQKDFLKTWGVDTGLVSQQSADEWAKRWQFYVPFNRAVSQEKRGIGAKRGFANQNSTIKQARGSGKEIINPVDNIINNLVKMVNAGVRNNVMRRITDEANRLGADAFFLEKVPTPMVKREFDMTGVKEQLTDWIEGSAMHQTDKDQATGIIGNLDDVLAQYGRGKAHGDVITVLKGGRPEFWKINDPLMLSSITNMSPKKMDGILDSYAVVSRFMTGNITGNNIIWSLFSNFPRDLGTFFTYSKVRNPVKVFASMGSAYVNQIKGDNADPLFKEYLAMGGGKTSAYTADRDLAKKARKSLSEKKIDVNPLDWITFVSDTVELGPRFATYKLMRQTGMNPQEAFYEACDITVNFRRSGDVSRQINKVVPFFNASVQGLDKFRRWITAADAPQADRAKTVRSRMIAYIAVSAALAAVFYGINNGDDDKEKDYQQLSNYTKNTYWNIPIGDGKYFAIPKPRELAVLSSFFETCMEYGLGGNEHAFDEFYEYATDNFLPSVVSDLAQVPVNGLMESASGAAGSLGIFGVVGYMSANRDFLGRPIVSAGLQNLEPKDRYTERTSKIAYWVGQAFNVSPQMVDYFFNSTLGGWWKSQKALFPVGKENVDLTLGVQNTYIKDNQYSTDLVNWLYDKADASKRAKNSDQKDMEKAITYKMDSNMTTFYSRYYKLAKNQPETTASRATRQIVLDMILEYRKSADAGTFTRAQDAVNAVCDRAGSTEFLPSVMQSTIKDGGGTPHTLSDVQYVEYQTDYLRIYWENVEQNLSGAKTDAEKFAVLKAAKEVAKEQTTNRTLKRIGAETTNFLEKYKNVGTNDVIQFQAQLDLADDDGSLKQDEVISILQAMIQEGLSYDDAYLLFHSRYDSDKNNPWRRYKP